MTRPDEKLRVLFVDDDRQILAGIRGSLRRHRSRWEMQFAEDGPEALRLADAWPPDVVVSDMRMPGMDGAELLERFRREHPAAGRVTLSGQADTGLRERALPVTHQWLSKPCEREELVSVIERWEQARAILPVEALRSLVLSVSSLPTTPGVQRQLLDALSDDRNDGATIARLLEADPALCAKTLQIANSALLGVGQGVRDIGQAVNLLGRDLLGEILVTAGVFEDVDRICPNPLVDLASIQNRGHRTALAHSWLHARRGRPGRRSGSTEMLLDVGILLLASRERERYAVVLDRWRNESIPLVVAEREVLGASHDRVGGCLLLAWGLPTRMAELVGRHHDPIAPDEEDTEERRDLRLAHVVACESPEGPVDDVGDEDPALVEALRTWLHESASLEEGQDRHRAAGRDLR